MFCFYKAGNLSIVL